MTYYIFSPIYSPRKRPNTINENEINSDENDINTNKKRNKAYLDFSYNKGDLINFSGTSLHSKKIFHKNIKKIRTYLNFGKISTGMPLLYDLSQSIKNCHLEDQLDTERLLILLSPWAKYF